MALNPGTLEGGHRGAVRAVPDGARARGSCVAAALWVAVLPITARALYLVSVWSYHDEHLCWRGSQALALAVLALILVRALWRHVPRAARVVLALHVPVNLLTIFIAGAGMLNAWC